MTALSWEPIELAVILGGVPGYAVQEPSSAGKRSASDTSPDLGPHRKEPGRGEVAQVAYPLPTTGTRLPGRSCGGTSAAPRRLDGFFAAGRQRLGQYARRDLPGDAPLVFAPAAL